MKLTTLSVITAAIFSIAELFIIISKPGYNNAWAMNAHDHGHGHVDHKDSGRSVKALIELQTEPESIQAQSEASLIFSVKDIHGKPVQDLTVSHERLLHIIIVSEDLTIFKHIHPEDFGPITDEMKKQARFKIKYAFPKSGRYIVSVDSAVKGQNILSHFFVDVDGEPLMGTVNKDISREKKFGNYSVVLTSVPERIKAGQKTLLRFNISKNSSSVADLAPYLGAPMHLAILLADLNSFTHAHGEIDKESSGHPPTGHVHGMADEHFGPEIWANLTFPVKGLYQIFAEVKHHDRIVVMNFMVEAE